MFKSKPKTMAKFNNEQENQIINLIGAETIIKGDITTNGNIRIDGTLIGSLQVKGKLVIGENGKIEGNVICKNADISGTAKVKIKVAELLTLKSSAKLIGEIITTKLSIEPGANFSGNCRMGNDKQIIEEANLKQTNPYNKQENIKEKELAQTKK